MNRAGAALPILQFPFRGGRAEWGGGQSWEVTQVGVGADR